MAPRKKTTKSATATATHPTYATMIHESLENNKPHMTSLVLLKNMIEQNYEVTPKKHALLSALAKGVESGDVVKVKGSYRLKGKGNSGTSSGRTRSASTTVKKSESKPKKSIEKKKTPKKRTSKTSTAAGKPKEVEKKKRPPPRARGGAVLRSRARK